MKPPLTSPEFAEEVLDDLDVLRARDPRGLLPAVAGAGAQVRETARLTDEAGLGRVTEGGGPRGLVIVARREGAWQPRCSAPAGPSSPSPSTSCPGRTCPSGPVPATSPSSPPAPVRAVRRHPAYEAARRGVSLVGIGADDAPLRAACSNARAPYVALPHSRVRHTTLWSLLTLCCTWPPSSRPAPAGTADPEAIAAALDEVAGECGRAGAAARGLVGAVRAARGLRHRLAAGATGLAAGLLPGAWSSARWLGWFYN